MSDDSGAAISAALRARWLGLAERERLLLQAAGVLLVVGVLWIFAVQPAWRTITRAPLEFDALDAQWQAMQHLAAEAQQLRATPAVTSEQAASALKAATERLGDKGKLVLQGERAVLTASGLGTAALRDWLSEARAGAHARPVEANLSRGAQGYTGTLVLAIGGGS